MAELLEDFPAGPLDLYRRKASFDWKQMKLFLFGEEEIRHSHHIWQVLRRYPEFQPIQTPLDFDAERHLAFKQAAIIRHHQAEIYDTKFNAFSDYAPAALVKMGLGIKIFTGILEKLGSERHRGIIQEIRQGKVSGCFAMTEIGHGTNVKGMKTSATYLSESEEFELHTPDFLAAKCWAGNLGNVATHAIVYAQLYVSGVHHGLHVFVVPIRDPETLQPFPGVTVGDMGEKIGLNGIDNGFLLFSHYRIPRAYLLNDTGDVTEEGRYVTPYQNESQRFGASLLALSASRVWVTAQSDAYGGCALTTALRYSAVRRQFAPSEGEQEVAILEYQTQQYRLLPHLAAAYMLKVFTRYLNDVFEQMIGQ
uniref:Acyl-CoA oxidase/dehydrogenase middle domain-containing protein n=2 Tax=Dendroctonus ponderosae TaxID=77166 RepID=A0AAR5PQV9_DENPD